MDWYTKSILTVIAAALSTIAIQNSGIIPAYAQEPQPMKVQVCHWNGTCASVNNDGYLLVHSEQSTK
jgi:hypothetical protein